MDCILNLFDLNFHPVRPLRVLRVYFILENSRQSRANARYYLRLIPTIIKIFLLIIFYIMVFSAIGQIVFQDIKEETHFSSFGVTFQTMFLTLTTVIYPDISLPAW
jgi:hypothetical protein